MRQWGREPWGEKDFKIKWWLKYLAWPNGYPLLSSCAVVSCFWGSSAQRCWSHSCSISSQVYTHKRVFLDFSPIPRLKGAPVNRFQHQKWNVIYHNVLYVLKHCSHFFRDAKQHKKNGSRMIHWIQGSDNKLRQPSLLLLAWGESLGRWILKASAAILDFQGY